MGSLEKLLQENGYTKTLAGDNWWEEMSVISAPKGIWDEDKWKKKTKQVLSEKDFPRLEAAARKVWVSSWLQLNDWGQLGLQQWCEV